jgi:transposase
MYTLGIDVHKNESQIVVLDDDDEIHEEVRVRNANLDEIAQQYAGAEAAIEATSNYYAIYDTLDEYLDVVVADPNQTKALGVVEAKNDRLDAKLREQLRSAKLIAQSYVPPKEIRERRALVRGRKQLVEKQTDFKNQVHAILDQQGISYEWDPFSQKGREVLAGEDLSLGSVARTLIESYLEVIDTLDEKISELEDVIQERAASLEETQRLMSIPGVSFYSSLLITSELGEIERFGRDKEVVSYAGLDPVVRESADSRTEGSISKRGNPQLRSILVQCAKVAVHRSNDEYLSRFFDRLKRRKNYSIAIVATARKLLVSIYHMLDRKEVYDPPGVGE